MLLGNLVPVLCKQLAQLRLPKQSLVRLIQETLWGIHKNTCSSVYPSVWDLNKPNFLSAAKRRWLHLHYVSVGDVVLRVNVMGKKGCRHVALFIKMAGQSSTMQ